MKGLKIVGFMNSDFSFHWMMENISCFNVSEKPEGDIKTTNVFHHPVKDKI